jgi:hypothetical protein
MDTKQPTKRSNHEADMSNRNKHTSGTNITLDKNQGNRSKQLTENRNRK